MSDQNRLLLDDSRGIRVMSQSNESDSESDFMKIMLLTSFKSLRLHISTNQIRHGVQKENLKTFSNFFVENRT